MTILALLLAGCSQAPQETPEIKPYFCPKDMCEERAAIAIESATTSIDVAMYSFTSDRLARALENKAKKGVKVRVVADYLQSKSTYADFNEMEEAGVEVRFAPKSRTMHNKFAVIDGKLTMTGSFNWTKNADTSNFENLVFIEGAETAKEYENEFFEIWVQSG